MKTQKPVVSTRGAGAPLDQPGLTGGLEDVATGMGQRVAD
jgi:hypothetical protein